MTIDAYSMAKMYWRMLHQASINEVEHLLHRTKSEAGKTYWNEVLTYLNVRLNGKKSLS